MITRYPRGVRTASSRRRLTDWSSTASTVTGSSIDRPFLARAPTPRSASIRSSRLTGLSNWTSAPRACPRGRSSTTEAMTTGMAAVSSAALSSASTCQPSSRGSLMSSTTAAGSTLRISSRALTPSVARITCTGASSRYADMRSSDARSSSTSTTTGNSPCAASATSSSGRGTAGIAKPNVLPTAYSAFQPHAAARTARRSVVTASARARCPLPWPARGHPAGRSRRSVS